MMIWRQFPLRQSWNNIIWKASMIRRALMNDERAGKLMAASGGMPNRKLLGLRQGLLGTLEPLRIDYTYGTTE